MEHEKIHTEHERPMLKDMLRGDFKFSEIPTVTVKRYFRYVDGLTLDKVAGSVTVSGTAALRLTKLNLAAIQSETMEFSLADKDGTFATYLLGTTVAVAGGRGIQQQILLQGAPNTPIHTVRPGTFNIYNTGGSQAAGTYIVSFEGIQS